MFENLTSTEMFKNVHELVKEETRLTYQIVQYIRAIDYRKLYLELGYDSIFSFLTQELKYCESSAYRRMQVANLCTDVPVLEEKLKSGELNLTTAAKVQTFIRAEEKRNNVKLTCERKVELVNCVAGLSVKKATQELMRELPQAVVQVEERLKTLSPDKSQMTVVLTQEQLNMLNRLKEIYSHQLHNPSWGELISYMADKLLKKDDPLMTKSICSKAHVFKRDNGCCSYVDPISKQKCGSKYQVQVDHIQPKAFGGSDELDNLRLLCRNHNIYMAEKNLGAEKMRRYRS